MNCFWRFVRSTAVREVGLLALLVNTLASTMPAFAGGEQALRIVAFGDSLTAGYMLKPTDAFPAQLERTLNAQGHQVEIVNAGVSGDTTSSGLARFEWAIGEGTDAVILELGANDALRGVDPTTTESNLAAILSRLDARGIPVLITGMRAPGNWGEAYARRFDAIFPRLAEAGGHLYYPFFLDGVAIDPALNLDDGLHPNAAGVAKIVNSILPLAEQLIERARNNRSSAGKS